MIEQSEQIGDLAEALVLVQKDLPVITKTKTAKVPTKSGGEYSYDYADLEDCVTETRPLLAGAGLAVTQWPAWDGHHDLLVTQVAHTSGQWMRSAMRMPDPGQTPQSLGSAITYARRYAYCAALGIVADKDDDGAASTHAAKFLRCCGQSEADGHRPDCPAMAEQNATRTVSEAFPGAREEHPPAPPVPRGATRPSGGRGPAAKVWAVCKAANLDPVAEARNVLGDLDCKVLELDAARAGKVLDALKARGIQ